MNLLWLADQVTSPRRPAAGLLEELCPSVCWELTGDRSPAVPSPVSRPAKPGPLSPVRQSPAVPSPVSRPAKPGPAPIDHPRARLARVPREMRGRFNLWHNMTERIWNAIRRHRK